MGRELTPAQHAVIRRQLTLIPVYIWLVYSWMHILVRIPLDEPVRDFTHFYVQGVIALERDAASLYDIDRMADVAQRVLPGHQRVLYPPVYGPQMSLLFMPLATLPYMYARHTWVVITVLLYAACAYAIWRVCPRLHDRPWTTTVLVAAAPQLHYVLGFVQVSVIGLICVTVAFLALRANRPFLAGLALGSLAYKPPLAIGVGIVLFCDLIATQTRLAQPTLKHDGSDSLAKPKLAQRWSARRLVIGAIVAAVGQVAIGVAYWGPSILPPYLAALTRLPDVTDAMEPHRYHMHSWRTFFDLLGLPRLLALGAYLLASAATIAAAIVCWRSRGPVPLRSAAVIIATILVDPHLYAYDLVLLIPAFLVLWDWALGQPRRTVAETIPALTASAKASALKKRCATWRFRSAFIWLVYICYLSPLFVTLADVARIQLSPLLLGLLVVVIFGVLRGEEWRSEPVAS
jgi:glycosyl transferase family 87